jgi:hypothetical protein
MKSMFEIYLTSRGPSNAKKGARIIDRWMKVCSDDYVFCPMPFFSKPDHEQAVTPSVASDPGPRAVQLLASNHLGSSYHTVWMQGPRLKWRISKLCDNSLAHYKFNGASKCQLAEMIHVHAEAAKSTKSAA